MHRIALDPPAADWIARFLNRPGFAPAPLNPGSAARACDMKPFAHRNPADRLLMATAIAHEPERKHDPILTIVHDYHAWTRVHFTPLRQPVNVGPGTHFAASQMPPPRRG
ncbi:MAG TPA: hypothetical protein VHX61_00455 [Rhizomicrobium sp.]|nr:hypothetical protein [Rhizomicrobium sp.]